MKFIYIVNVSLMKGFGVNLLFVKLVNKKVIVNV